MAIPEAMRANFNTLLRAAAAGHLALMECQDAQTGENRAVICAVQPPDKKDGELVFTPFGHLCPGNPYEAYIPPT